MKNRALSSAVGLPVISSRIPHTAWKDIDGDLGEFFLRKMVTAGKRLFLRDGHLVPVVHAMGHDTSSTSRAWRRTPQLMQHSVMIAPLMGNDEQKQVLADVMPDLLNTVGAFCVVKCVECWMLQGADASTAYKHGSLKLHPDSIEALTFLLESATDSRMEIYPIERGADGVVTGLGENSVPSSDGQLMGTFANWLQPPPNKGAN